MSKRTAHRLSLPSLPGTSAGRAPVLFARKNAALARDYTPLVKVTAGMSVRRGIAALPRQSAGPGCQMVLARSDRVALYVV